VQQALQGLQPLLQQRVFRADAAHQLRPVQLLVAGNDSVDNGNPDAAADIAQQIEKPAGVALRRRLAEVVRIFAGVGFLFAVGARQLHVDSEIAVQVGLRAVEVEVANRIPP
jgi:hypothetical protein